MLPEWLLRTIAGVVQRNRSLGPSLDITRIVVPMPGLAPAFEGLEIVHISDLHVGEFPWEPRTTDAVSFVQKTAPDIVINTGDYLQGDPPVERVRELVEPFVVRQNRRGLPTMNLSILGNHDYFVDDESVSRLADELGVLGIEVLENRVVTYHRDEASLTFVGLTLDRPGFDAALQQFLQCSRPRIAIIHEPDIADTLPVDTADLVLAGHTHGGQIVAPGLRALIAHHFGNTHYVDGFYHVNGMLMYVNRGLGYTGLPLRVSARPEVCLVRLTR